VFGKVIDGFSVLDTIEKTPGDERDRPLRDVKIEKVTVHANPLA
jgi:peptidyl-prolyl cis-trans isomerase-like 3